MFFSIGYDAGYKCVLCNKFYKFDDIDKSNWKCVICGEYIRIAAPELKSGHIKIRKKAKDIQPMDGVNVADKVVGLWQNANFIRDWTYTKLRDFTWLGQGVDS